jgi:small subunit ribosomal protein S15
MTEPKISKEDNKLSWIKTKPEELKKIILSLAKENNSPAKIGLILRDKHGIPKAKLLGKKISQILKESGHPYITEKNIIDSKIKKLKAHKENHKHDNSASRSLTKKLWHSYHLSQSN